MSNPSQSRAATLWRNPEAVITACAAALAGDRLRPGQNVRRAHLLRSKAAAHLSLGQYSDALEAITLARQTLASGLQQSLRPDLMRVSLDLLEALTRAANGDSAQASELVQRARAARPFALEIQLVASRILALDQSTWQPDAEILRLSPGDRNGAIIRLVDAGRFAAAAQIGRHHELPQLVPEAAGTNFELKILVWADLAYAFAAIGDVEHARALLGQLPASNSTALTGASNQRALVRGKLTAARARLAIAEGRLDDLQNLLATPVQLRQNGQTADLIAAAQEALQPQDGSSTTPTFASTPDISESRERSSIRPSQIADLLPSILFYPESASNVDDYRPARVSLASALGGTLLGPPREPGDNGALVSGSGFRHTTASDGAIEVRLSGPTLSLPMVQEMTLLRAAEIAREQGMPAFLILDNEENARLVLRGDDPITQEGFVAMRTVRLLADGASNPFAFNADEVIARLGPIYSPQP
jgi:hypothetical protein